MTFDQLDLNKYYTYQDYMSWRFKERVELLLGKVFKMSPAPNRRHQTISLNLTLVLGNALSRRDCEMYTAPFDVRLPVSLKEGKEDSVVQPDICVICDPSKLDEQGCKGAPDLIIEILSPGNSTREMKDKFTLYEQSLVKEYWIVDQVRDSILIYTLNNEGKYIGSRPFVAGDTVSTELIPGLTINVESVFDTQ